MFAGMMGGLRASRRESKLQVTRAGGRQIAETC
jgi:hypothetical protein